MATQTLRTVLVALLVFGVARPAVSAPRLLPRAEVLAAVGPKLLVMVAPLDAPARAQAGLLEHAAETAVKSQGRFLLLRTADALDGRAARARQDAAEKAKKLDKEGRQKLDDLDAVAGGSLLGEALVAWRAADLTEHFKDFVSTWSARGGAYASGDENVKARQDIERILAVAPDAQFSNAWYPPELLKFSEAQRKSVANAAGELTVRSEPVGARIWVDGVYRGVAPTTVKGLANGRHFVTALLAGRSVWQSEVPLGDELVKLEPAEGSANWKKTLEKVGKDPDGQGRDEAARELAAATGAEQVLVLVARKSASGNQLELTGVRIEAGDGHNAGYAKQAVPMDSPEAVDALVMRLLEKDTPRANGKAVTHFVTTGVTPTRRIVGLSVMGAGVALAVTGAIFGGLALGKQEEYRRTVQVETVKAQSIAEQGRAFAVVCDVTLITGLVAAAAGGVLGFTTLGQNWFQPSGAPPPEEKPKAKKKEDEAPPPKKEEPKKEEPRKEEPKKEESDEGKGKKGKKDKKAEAEERRKKEEEERKAREEEKRAREEEERRKKEEERRKKEEDEARKKAEEEAKKKGSKKKEEEEAARKKADEEAKKKADEDTKKKAEEEKKKKAEEEKKKKAEEEAKKKKADEKKDEDHDDLRNY